MKTNKQKQIECNCECHLGFPWQEINGECIHCRPEDMTKNTKTGEERDKMLQDFCDALVETRTLVNRGKTYKIIELSQANASLIAEVEKLAEVKQEQSHLFSTEGYLKALEDVIALLKGKGNKE